MALARQHDTRMLAKQVETLPEALGLIKDLHKDLHDAQQAVVQVLKELDSVDFEARRQRAVFLRMHIDAQAGRAPKAGWVLGTKYAAEFEAYIKAMLAYEEEIRGEYDAIFGLVMAFTPKDVPKQSEET